MTEPISDERLAEIEARLEHATPGPWQRSGIRMKLTADCIQVCTLDGSGWIFLPVGKGQPGAIWDAEFVAHARQDVPDLIAEIRRLR